MIKNIGGAFVRLSVAVSVITLSLVGAVLADPARAAVRAHTEIPAGNLAIALKSLADQRGFQIVFATQDVASLRTDGAVGELTSNEALKRLLGNTGLTYQYLDDKTVTISRADGSASSGEGQVVTTAQSLSQAKKEDGKSSSQGFRVAQMDQGGARDSLTPEKAAARPAGSDLSEIVVTARKREERLQDVPVPVTALNAESLAEQNLVRLQDYATTVPGFTVAPSAIQGAQVLSIRGITTGSGTNPTVGITVDGVPYGSSTNLGGGSVVPDVDPSDLARIEVLRGPQGTLYGASSMGGLVNFVTVDPSTQALSGRMEGGLSGVSNGAEVGYNARAAINVPVSDTLAIRASAFTRQDPGYIDNPILHIDGLNKDEFRGGRLATLWKPNDVFSLKLSALYQESKGDGGSDVDRPNPAYPDETQGLGDLQQNYIRGIGGFDRTLQAYSATANLKFAGMNLTSVTGYNVNTYKDSWDYSYQLGAVAQIYGANGAFVTDNNRTRKVTQELRLTGSWGASFDWLLGAFYTHERTTDDEDVSAADHDTGAIAPGGLDFLTISFPTTYSEYAGFADLTYRFTDQVDVQVGARESHIKQWGQETEGLGFLGIPPTASPPASGSANAFTYLVTPRWKVTDDFMLYARMASGYRAGGANLTYGSGTPAEYNPDRTESYEAGMKASFLAQTLTVDASIYYINWKDIQIGLYNPTTGVDYTANGGHARSDGVELSVGYKPTPGLNLAAWVVYDDAVLTQSFPASTAASGQSGDRLPFTSRYSGNASADQSFPLSFASMNGFVGGTVSYVGDRKEIFSLIDPTNPGTIPARQDLPGYAKLDLRAGIKTEQWTGTLYATNVTNRRGLLAGGTGEVPPYAFVYTQPRVIGVTVARKF